MPGMGGAKFHLSKLNFLLDNIKNVMPIAGTEAVSTGLFSGNTKTQKHTFPANQFLKSTQPHLQAQNAKT
jgi:hypothetical protein